MIYKVKRTSCISGKPCEEAVEVRLETLEKYDLLAFSYKPFWYRERWGDSGINHGQDADHVWRTNVETWYKIDLPDSEILGFVKKYGKVVISIDPCGHPCIEIYDGYRE